MTRQINGGLFADLTALAKLDLLRQKKPEENSTLVILDAALLTDHRTLNKPMLTCLQAWIQSLKASQKIKVVILARLNPEQLIEGQDSAVRITLDEFKHSCNTDNVAMTLFDKVCATKTSHFSSVRPIRFLTAIGENENYNSKNAIILSRDPVFSTAATNSSCQSFSMPVLECDYEINIGAIPTPEILQQKTIKTIIVHVDIDDTLLLYHESKRRQATCISPAVVDTLSELQDYYTSLGTAIEFHIATARSIWPARYQSNPESINSVITAVANMTKQNTGGAIKLKITEQSHRNITSYSQPDVNWKYKGFSADKHVFNILVDDNPLELKAANEANQRGVAHIATIAVKHDYIQELPEALMQPPVEKTSSMLTP